MEACNEVLRVHAPRGWLFFIAFLGCFACIPIGIFAKPGYYECTDPNGCRWDCCIGRQGRTCNRVTPEEVSFGQECACRRSGKRTICDGYVEVTGLHVAHATTQWLWALGGLALAITFLGVAIYSGIKTCLLGKKMRACFKEWEQKGLNCRYIGGSKHQQACIIVTVMQRSN